MLISIDKVYSANGAGAAPKALFPVNAASAGVIVPFSSGQSL